MKLERRAWTPGAAPCLMPAMENLDPEVARIQGSLDQLRELALAVGLTDIEIEALSWRARDEAFGPSSASFLEIYQRLIDEAIAERSAR